MASGSYPTSSPPPFAHHDAAVLSSPLPAAQCWACAPPAWQTGGEPGVGGAVIAAGGGWGRGRSGDGRQRGRQDGREMRWWWEVEDEGILV